MKKMAKLLKKKRILIGVKVSVILFFFHEKMSKIGKGKI